VRATGARWPPWAVLVVATAALWSLAYLALGIAWLFGAPGNPADPVVDRAPGLSPIGMWGPRVGAAMITALAGLGVLLNGALAVMKPGPGPVGLRHRTPILLACALGVVLAVALPDYRLLAAIAYTPILLVLTLTGTAPDGATAWPWPVMNMGILTLAGLAWMATAAVHHRRLTRACVACGRGDRDPRWMRPDNAARWGRWATVVAVSVPLGYAATRFAWAVGIPLGVSQKLLDDLGNAVYAGAALGGLAVAGGLLTLGLVQRWGEVFPRWMLGLRGRRVPIALAVVPAAVVAVALASAGLMFVRFAVTGQFGDTFPGENGDIAAWLPEMFWPLWAVALAAAAYAYWLRRRGRCRYCGRG
jgi:hypothetical protein